MRLFRLSLLQTYFSIVKNKKKALLIINIGIFLSIFAASSSAISYFIEKKISNKEFELIEWQMYLRESSKTILIVQDVIIEMESILRNEERQESDFIFLNTLKFGQKTVSNKDYYLPYIYSNIKGINQLNELFDSMGGIELLYEWMISFTDHWDEIYTSDIKKVIKDLKSNTLQIKYLEKIDYYKDIYNQSFESIFDEIVNYKEFSINQGPDDILWQQYTDLKNFNDSFLGFFQSLRTLLHGDEQTDKREIKRLEGEIISLSKTEKNLVIITFILQLFIFLIIQIFEISSMNLGKKIKKIIK